MKNSSVPNVRLVRCPKCSEVLPEPADVPFYRCGGCDTILQAKHYKRGNEGSKPVSESSSSVQSNEEQEHVLGGEASNSNSPVMDQKRGLNPSSAQNEILQQPGVSNASTEASSSSQSKQQVPSSSSSSQPFLDLDEETDQSLEVTNPLRIDSSLNEPSPSDHEVPPNLDPETDEVESDSRASSSDESVEQLPQITPENEEVRQDEIVVEEHLEAADSSSEAASPEATTAKTYWDAHELNQNVSVNCRLEQPIASSFSVEALSSNEPSLHETNNSSPVASEEGQIDRSSKKVKEHLEVSNSRSEATLTTEPTAGGGELSSQLGLPNEDVITMAQHFVANPWERQPGFGVMCEGEEISSTNEPVFILKSDGPSQSITGNREGEADNVGDICGKDENVYSHTVSSSNQSTPVENKERSKLVTEIPEMDGGGTVQNDLGISNDDLAVDDLPGEFFSPAGVNSEDENVYSHTVSSSDQSTPVENKERSKLVTEIPEMDGGGTVQKDSGISNEDLAGDDLPGEIFSPAGVNLKTTDGSAFVLPEAENEAGSNLSSKSEISTPPDEKGNTEPQHSVQGDGNNRDPALSTLEATMGAEALNYDDRSQRTVEKNSEKQIEELQNASPDGFEIAETTEASDKGLPKSPARSSLAYDGSVSSYDGADDQVKYKIPSETTQGINKTESPTAEDQRQYLSKGSMTYGSSAFQRRMDNLQAASVGEDLDHHSEQQSTPIMLKEIKMPEVLSEASYRSNRTRSRREEFPPRVQQYRRSPETRYESSVHKDFYDHPVYYPPYRYRDVESRVTERHLRRSEVDGRMISDTVWMGEEFHTRPYHKSSGEIYPYPRHQMYYHGRRQAEYQPQVPSISRVPYSGETVRSGYRVHDSYSHHYSGDMRWSSHLPPPGLSYSRGWNSPREPFDSYNASPQVFTDSDYYSWSHDTISEDQRHSGQRTSRVQMRRNPQPVQHFQPIGGAAPFITCYNCSELLQLPSDFLVFKGKKIHRVKCSACSNILKFTLEKGRHLVPCVLKPAAQLREYPEKGDADKLLKSASTSQANHNYEGSYRRSASNSIYAGSSQAQNSERVSLRSSSQASERPRSKFESNPSQDKGKSVMMEMHKQNYAAGGSPTNIPRHAKVTWKVPDRSSSPLHRLMGYSSPSAVLYGYGSPDEFELQEYSRN